MDDEKNEDDFEIPFQVYGSEFVVLVDSMSMTYLTGAIVDYKEDINGSQFNIKNPNAQTTCGCGSSFSA
jgi:iron-sulfur cluster insertion protein